MLLLYFIPIVGFSKFKTNPEKIDQGVLNACEFIGFFHMINYLQKTLAR